MKWLVICEHLMSFLGLYDIYSYCHLLFIIVITFTGSRLCSPVWLMLIWSFVNLRTSSILNHTVCLRNAIHIIVCVMFVLCNCCGGNVIWFSTFIWRGDGSLLYWNCIVLYVSLSNLLTLSQIMECRLVHDRIV